MTYLRKILRKVIPGKTVSPRVTMEDDASDTDDDEFHDTSDSFFENVEGELHGDNEDVHDKHF